MAFSVKSKKSGKMYFLHSKEVELAGGRKQVIFYLLAKLQKMHLMHCLQDTK